MKNKIGYAFGPLNGLGVKKGRLVNDSPRAVSGLSKMAEMRKEMKRQQKIDVIRTGTYEGEMMSDLDRRLKWTED